MNIFVCLFLHDLLIDASHSPHATHDVRTLCLWGRVHATDARENVGHCVSAEYAIRELTMVDKISLKMSCNPLPSWRTSQL
jgi:hypothetical protein